MNFIISLILSTIAVFAAGYIVPGVQIDSLTTALIVALVLGLVNATIGFLLKMITAPLNWLTLGLVSLIINVLMVLLVDNLSIDLIPMVSGLQQSLLLSSPSFSRFSE
jgi:putative membrane protein